MFVPRFRSIEKLRNCPLFLLIKLIPLIMILPIMVSACVKQLLHWCAFQGGVTGGVNEVRHSRVIRAPASINRIAGRNDGRGPCYKFLVLEIGIFSRKPGVAPR